MPHSWSPTPARTCWRRPRWRQAWSQPPGRTEFRLCGSQRLSDDPPTIQMLARTGARTFQVWVRARVYRNRNGRFRPRNRWFCRRWSQEDRAWRPRPNQRRPQCTDRNRCRRRPSTAGSVSRTCASWVFSGTTTLASTKRSRDLRRSERTLGQLRPRWTWTTGAISSGSRMRRKISGSQGQQFEPWRLAGRGTAGRPESDGEWGMVDPDGG